MEPGPNPRSNRGATRLRAGVTRKAGGKPGQIDSGWRRTKCFFSRHFRESLQLVGIFRRLTFLHITVCLVRLVKNA